MNRNKFFALLAACAVASASHAALYTFTGTGGALVDAGNVVFSINLSGTGLTIVDVKNVTLTSVTHTWVGDNEVIFKKSGGAATTLFSPPDGESSNLNGTYVMVDQAGFASIDEVSGPLTSSQNIPGGTYRTTSYGGGTAFGANTSYTAFDGGSVDGTWQLDITDFASSDTGALTSWSFTVEAVPEPATMATLGLGAVALMRRRKSK